MTPASPACSAPGLMKSLEPSGFGETYESWVTRLRADCSLRQKSARATSESEYSSSQWRTPTDDSRRGGPSSGEKRLEGGHTMNLQDQVQDFKTWPTPATRDYKGANSADHLENGTGAKHLDQLPNFVEHVWSTPRASDEEKGRPNQSFGAGGQPLPSQTVDMMAYINSNSWPTPTAMNRPRSDETMEKVRANRKEKAGQNTVPLYLEDVATRLSLPVPVMLTDGAESSKERRSLNPLFVEWLMGWPPGWTLLAWTDLGCSETEWSRWRAAMQSELLRIGLPREAPPEQMSLFG